METSIALTASKRIHPIGDPEIQDSVCIPCDNCMSCRNHSLEGVRKMPVLNYADAREQVKEPERTGKNQLSIFYSCDTCDTIRVFGSMRLPNDDEVDIAA